MTARVAALLGVALAAGCHLIGGAGEYVIGVGGMGSGGGAGGAGPTCPGGVSCPDGAPCATDDMCESGHCVDGVCCASVCEDGCSACNLAGNLGACRPYAPATDPEAECAPGVCDGSGSCADGGARWLVTMGNASQPLFAGGAAVDRAANVVVAGRFRDSVDFGGGGMASMAAKHDAFLAKYAFDGSYLWARTVGNGVEDQFAEDVATDSASNILVAGRFRGAVDFGGGSVASVAGKYDGYLAKYDPQGNLEWVKTFGNGVHDQHVLAVATGPDDGVAVVGRFKAAVDFGGGPVSSAADRYDVFIAHYDATGHLRWVRTIGNGAHDQRVTATAIDPSGAVLVCGSFKESVDFGGGPIGTVAAKYDGYVVKYTASGGYAWSATFGNGAHDQHADDVAVGGSGNILVAGRFAGPVDFGGGEAVPAGSRYDGFLIKLDAEGGYRWSRTLGDGLADLHAAAVAADAAGNVVLAGRFTGAMDPGNGPQSSAGAAYDVFVAKYDPEGVFLWSRMFGNGLDDQRAEALSIGDGGDIALVGGFVGSVDFGTGPVSSTAATEDGFVLKLAP